MSNSTTPVAISVRDVRVTFLSCKDLNEVLLSVPQIKPLHGLIDRTGELRVPKEVLKGLSFDIHEGTIHGLFGMNGAGKSTTLYLLNGTISPSSGEVLVYGRDRHLDQPWGRERIAKCRVDELFEHFTAKANILMGTLLYGMDADAAWAKASATLTQLGMPSEVQESLPVSSMSDGTKAKVAIVRALTLAQRPREAGTPPPILLFDEPSRGLDVTSVAELFKILARLREEIPGLTVVIATNDPREAGQCERYTAIVDGVAHYDEEKLEQLRSAMGHANRGLEVFTSIVTPAQASRPAQKPKKAQNFPRLFRRGALGAFAWRAWCDLKAAKLLFALVVVSLVVPNLVGLFAAKNRTDGMGQWGAFVMGCLGIYASLIIREAFRFLDRERSYYKAFELVMGAPIPRWKHWLGTTMSSLVIHGCAACVAWLILGGLLCTESGFREQAAAAIGNLTCSSVASASVVLFACTLSFLAIGLVAALVPFIMRGDQAFFLLSLLPGIVVMTSGVFYETAILPPLFRQAAEVNPLSYGAHALRHALDLSPGEPLPLARWVMEWIPGFGEYHADLMVLCGLSVVYFGIGVIIYRRGERFLRQLGRLRAQ